MDSGLVEEQQEVDIKASGKQQQQVEKFLSQTGVDITKLSGAQQAVVLDFVKRKRKARLAIPATIIMFAAICLVSLCIACNFVGSGKLWGIPDEYVVTTEQTIEVMQVSSELQEHMKVLVYFYAAVTMTLTGAIFCGVAAVGSAIEMNTRSRRDEKTLKAFLQDVG